MLVEYTLAGESQKAFELYRWFLPLLRMDTVAKFPQLIKQVQQEVGMGSARVRAPRMEVMGSDLDVLRTVVAEAIKTRPRLD